MVKKKNKVTKREKNPREKDPVIKMVKGYSIAGYGLIGKTKSGKEIPITTFTQFNNLMNEKLLDTLDQDMFLLLESLPNGWVIVQEHTLPKKTRDMLEEHGHL